MATAQETFKQAVIEPLKVNVGANTFSYTEYFALPPSQRSNDEAAVVDIQFTQKMLEWLGYDAGDIIYNRTTLGRPQDKPDFVVRMFGATAFLVEDKRTEKRFNDISLKQLRRYAVGTSGYCLWTNGRVIIGLRFDANGQYQTLVEVYVDSAFATQPSAFSQEANFEILRLLFQKARFADVPRFISAIAIDQHEWEQQAKSLTDEASLRTFISESRYVLEQLTTAIKARLNSVAADLETAVEDITASQHLYSTLVSDQQTQRWGWRSP